ncbi:MAG: flagellar hook basal-body protein [Novosphingobium sp.]
MSFYTSLNGLKNAQTDLGVISHTEFADIVVGSAFTNPKLVVGIGAAVESINQNFALGPIEQTGSALDLAINGDGFFTTKNVVTGQTLFTRNGSLTVDGGGHISDGSGNRLQVFPTSATGTITSTTPTDAVIPATNGTDASGNPIEFAGITVGDDGAVTASYADGSNVIIGKVALASFIAPQGLKQVGSSNWVTTGISGAPTYGQPSTGQYGSLLSGALERSNVDIAEELVSLITAQRNFQANAKAIDTATQISQTVIQLQS